MIDKTEVEELITNYARQDLQSALILISGMFIGLNEAYIELSNDSNEGDRYKDIKINGGYRDITIHELKKRDPA